MRNILYPLILSIGLSACGSPGVSTPTVVPFGDDVISIAVCSEQFPDTPLLDDGYYQFEVCGWPVYMNAELYADNKARKVFDALKSDLKKIQSDLPSVALDSLKQVNIWLELDAGSFSGGEYHPSSKWLADNGRPVKWAKGVQLANAQHYLTWVEQQPAMLLHELAHAFDDQQYGNNHPDLQAAFDNAKQSGIYDAVEYVNAETGLLKAYALNNAKEYFAELTEAYFWRNDYYPFDRQQLQNHDVQGYNAVKVMWEQE